MTRTARRFFRLMMCLVAILGTGACAIPTPGTPEKAPVTLPTEPAPAPSDPQPTPIPPLDSGKMFYNLPPAVLTTATGLYASPNRSEWIVPVEIPVGETVYVMGRNGTSTHLRVVWNTGVGWIPVSFSDYNAARDKLAALPVFKREPPACAVPLTTQFNLNSTWENRLGGRIRVAVVVDLFRSSYGDFPPATLSLTVNGKEMNTTRRQIVEQGQFSLKDVVFSLPGYLQGGDNLGYLLNTTSNEPLAFMATIFSVPENCVWETD